MNSRVSGWLRSVSIAIALTLLVGAAALAASPSPSAGAAGGDPRSSGEGPGLIGDPLTAILIVLGIGFVSLVVTYLYVRLTAGRTRP